MSGVRLWLDDFRSAPEGWTHVRSVNQAIRLLETGDVVEATINHYGPYNAPQEPPVSRIIYKYQTTSRPDLAPHAPLVAETPRGDVIHFGLDPKRELCVWVALDDAADTSLSVVYEVVATGQTFPSALAPVASTVVGAFVWHLVRHA